MRNMLKALSAFATTAGTHTFPVLTSHATAAVTELLPALWGRWKQENSFKPLVHQYGLNHFGDRETVPLENRPVANPVRTRLTRTIAKLDRILGTLQRRYPPTADDAPATIASDAPKRAKT